MTLAHRVPGIIAFSWLISVYMSPFTGGATGFPNTTEPSGTVSESFSRVLSSAKPYLPDNLPGGKLEEAAAAAA